MTPMRLTAAFLLSALAIAGSGSASGCGGGGSGGATSGSSGGSAAPLPAGVVSIASGFTVELVAEGLAMPAKLAFLPDGRLLYGELSSGNIRVLSAAGVLDPVPWAALAVETGPEKGLLGIAVSPSFASDATVYVRACVAGPSRQQVLRLTEGGGRGTVTSVVLDNLPVASVHNGGALLALGDGTLLTSVGDVNDPALSQSAGLAGRILRFLPDGSAPASNPTAGSLELARGLRNVYGMAVNVTTGSVYLAENGPAANDELNFLQPAKNFEWGATSSIPAQDVGLRLRLWPDVIAPTGLVSHTGRGMPAGVGGNLFIASYVDANVLRFVMSGAQLLDIDDESVLVAFDDAGTDGKPLDIVEGPDGALYVATFTAIYRVRGS